MIIEIDRDGSGMFDLRATAFMLSREQVGKIVSALKDLDVEVTVAGLEDQTIRFREGRKIGPQD